MCSVFACIIVKVMHADCVIGVKADKENTKQTKEAGGGRRKKATVVLAWL